MRKPGPTRDTSRPAQRLRNALPKRRIVPTVATVLADIVTVAQTEVAAIKARQLAGKMTGTDIRRLESLVKTIDGAQRTEERVLAAMGGEISDMSDEELEEEVGK